MIIFRDIFYLYTFILYVRFFEYSSKQHFILFSNVSTFLFIIHHSLQIQKQMLT